MKQAGYSKRPRGRSFERRPVKPPNRDDNKPRGNAQQHVDKYLALAREATVSGDPVAAESYYQYADHYHRLLTAQRASVKKEAELPADKPELESAPQVQIEPEPLPLPSIE